jgi:hypothetical protein
MIHKAQAINISSIGVKSFISFLSREHREHTYGALGLDQASKHMPLGSGIPKQLRA